MDEEKPLVSELLLKFSGQRVGGGPYRYSRQKKRRSSMRREVRYR